jgi:hypothetical protein
MTEGYDQYNGDAANAAPGATVHATTKPKTTPRNTLDRGPHLRTRQRGATNIISISCFIL